MREGEKVLGKTYMDMRFVAELTVITGLIVLGLLVPPLNLGALGICAWMIVFECGMDHILDLAFFLLPFSPIFKLDLKGFAFFNIIIILILFRILLYKGFSFAFPNLMPVILIGYYLVGIRNANITDCIRLISQMLIAMSILTIPNLQNEISIKRKNTMLSIGIIGSSVVALLRGVFPRLHRYLGTPARIKLGTLTYFNRFQGVEQNTNMYTVLISIALAVFMVYFVQDRLTRVDWILAGALCVFGAMTVSMSFILSLGIMILFTMVMVARHNPKMMGTALFIGLLLILITPLALEKSDIVSAIRFRLDCATAKSPNVADITSGRTEIWGWYLDYFVKNPLSFLFGRGIGAKIALKRPSHNYYLETVYYLGLLGSAIYILAHYAVFSPSRYCRGKISMYLHMPLIMLLIRGMARNLICEEKLMFIYLLYTLTAIEAQCLNKPEESATQSAKGEWIWDGSG